MKKSVQNLILWYWIYNYTDCLHGSIYTHENNRYARCHLRPCRACSFLWAGLWSVVFPCSFLCEIARFRSLISPQTFFFVKLLPILSISILGTQSKSSTMVLFCFQSWWIWVHTSQTPPLPFYGRGESTLNALTCCLYSTSLYFI